MYCFCYCLLLDLCCNRGSFFAVCLLTRFTSTLNQFFLGWWVFVELFVELFVEFMCFLYKFSEIGEK
jgi:hypothetical protein